MKTKQQIIEIEREKKKIINLNKTELKDLDYLMEKIVKGKPLYALEIRKAEYLLKRIKKLKNENHR